jgi:hypothetical protein
MKPFSSSYPHREVKERCWDYCYCYGYGVVSHKATHTLRPCVIYCVFSHLSPNHSWFIHKSSLAVTSIDTISEAGEILREMAEFCLRVIFFSYLLGCLTCRKILRLKDHPLSSVILRIQIFPGSLWILGHFLHSHAKDAPCLSQGTFLTSLDNVIKD